MSYSQEVIDLRNEVERLRKLLELYVQHLKIHHPTAEGLIENLETALKEDE